MEKRLYGRINIRLDSILYSKRHEFSGVIRDISEGGIKLVLTEGLGTPPGNDIKIGDKLFFQTMDVYDLCNIEHKDIVQGEAMIVRKQESDGQIILGCSFIRPSDRLREYVSNKKLLRFMESGYNVV